MSGLDTLTKSASISSETRSASRWTRFNLQGVIADVLPQHRCVVCGEKAVPNRVPALYEGADGGYFYGNVRACGSVWVCPYCAAKVGGRRAAELRTGIENAKAAGLAVSFLTFTVSHHAGQSLAELLDGYTRAMRRMRNGRAWQAFARQVGYVGSVRNLEVTWGERTGWHPHGHALWFTARPLNALEQAWVFMRWQAAAAAEGLTAGRRGFDVTTADAAVSGYLTKLGTASWAAPEELTMQHYKRGRGTRFAPFDLARGFGETGDLELADRFREYANAFHGRRQLYWSRGLRDLLGVGAEAADEEVANAHEDVARVVYAFTEQEWRTVARGRYQLLLLDAVVRGGYEGFYALLCDVMGYGSVEWFDPDAAGWNSGDSADGVPG